MPPGSEAAGCPAFGALTGALEQAGTAALVVGLDTDARWIAPSWATELGVDRDAVLADPCRLVDAVWPVDRATAAALATALRERIAAAEADPAADPAASPALRATLRFAAVDGTPAWREITATITGGNGQPRCVVVLAHGAPLSAPAREPDVDDGTEITAEFVSKMSHELRTPLHALMGYVQLLEMGVGDASEYLRRARRAGDHLAQLLNDLLDYSRLSAGRLVVGDEAVDLSAVLDDAVAMVRADAQAGGVSLLDASAEGFVVRGDATRLCQVVVNVVANGVKYSPPGSSVTVTASTDPAGPWHLVEVCDTGPGIAPDDLARLFVPFDRIGAERTAIAGAGVGLALSRGLVEAMGGTLEVDSTVGAGTCVRLRLRRAAP